MGGAFPDKPVRMVVPFPPGGMTDVLARTIAARLSVAWRQSVFIENRPGANSLVGTDSVARSEPDGHTLLVTSSALALNQALLQKLPFDASRDLTPVARLFEAPLVIVVHPGSEFKSIKEFNDRARATPVHVASPGQGSISHLAAAMYGARTQAKIVHIPYKGGGPAIADLQSGRANAMFAEASSVMGLVLEGKLRALAVTGDRRVPQLQNVPTVSESVLRGYAVVQWYGLFGPSRMPQELSRQIAMEVEKALLAAKVDYERFGQQAAFLPPEGFAKYLGEELSGWGRLVKEASIRLE
jgi:tripartite-type tricarboxylate transporter receptor subunit TctC